MNKSDKSMRNKAIASVLFLLLLSTSLSWSQTNLDSLQIEIKLTLDSAKKLRDKGGNSDTALEMIDTALYQLKHFLPIDTRQVLNALDLKGLILEDMGKNKIALMVLDSAIQLSKITHYDTGPLYANTLRHFAVSCIRDQKPNKAFNPIHNSIEIFERLADNNNILLSTTCLIDYYYAIQKTDSAINIINQIENDIDSRFDDSYIKFFFQTASNFYNRLGIEDKAERYDELISKLKTTSPYDQCLWKINHLLKSNNKLKDLNINQVYELIECSNSNLKNDTIIFAGSLNQLADILISTERSNFFLADSLLQVENKLLNIENLELKYLVNKEIFEPIITYYLEKCQMALKDSNFILLDTIVKSFDKLTNGFTNFHEIKNDKKELILIYSANYYSQIKDLRFNTLLDSYKIAANKHLDEALKFMTESELNQFIQNPLFSKIDLFYALYHPDLLEDSYPKYLYEQALKSKGILFRKTMYLKKFLQESKDSATIQLKNDWQILNAKINSDHEVISNSQYMKNQELERKALQMYADNTPREIFYIDSLQSKLKKNEIAVEFVKYKSIYGRINTEKYMAIILDNEHKYPKVISLCDENSLKPRLEYSTNKIDSSSNDNLRGYGLTPIKKKNLDLFKLIWESIVNEFPNTKTIYFSTVGQLDNINLSTILISDTSFMFDRYKMIQLSSTYDIIEQREINYDHSNKALLIGGVNYGNNNQQDDSSNEFNWIYLDGTLEEVNSINKIMLDKNITTTLLIDSHADAESVIQKMPENQTFIHIATHGYYNKSQDGVGGKLNFNKNNPLSRSVLVLSNANVPDSSKHKSKNAYLNAFEISNLDLSQTKLVVLSACESGLGDNVNQYESTNFSLIRGFKIAGAKSIISTLIPISDDATQSFMQIFYNYLFTDGLSIVDSFAKTQKKLKSLNPSDQNWTAFILLN